MSIEHLVEFINLVSTHYEFRSQLDPQRVGEYNWGSLQDETIEELNNYPEEMHAIGEFFGIEYNPKEFNETIREKIISCLNLEMAKPIGITSIEIEFLGLDEDIDEEKGDWNICKGDVITYNSKKITYSRVLEMMATFRVHPDFSNITHAELDTEKPNRIKFDVSH